MKAFLKKILNTFYHLFDVQERIFSSLPLKTIKILSTKPFFFGKAVYSGRELHELLLAKRDVNIIPFYT